MGFRFVAGIACLSFLAAPFAASAQFIRDIEFPVQGDVTFRDDFGDPRPGDRRHEGVDLLGEKMMPLLSAIDGRVSYVVNPEASWGYAIVLRDGDGWTYHYLHVNNDTPGTDDGQGGLQYAYALGVESGARVAKGQLVGWMGDSGNAENTTPHLHFEIRMPDGTPVNPYESLLAATRSGRYDPVAARLASPTINADKGLTEDPSVPVFCVSGALIKSPSSDAVYYCGADGKRYVFPNNRVFFTWYKDFSSVQIISDPELAAVPIGKLVTVRPGVKMVKIQSDPKVYAVARGGELRWITDPAVAAALYGTNWPAQVEDVSVAFFSSYHFGEPITTSQ